MTDPKSHWDNVYLTKKPSEVSWYQPHLRLSLELIERSGVAPADHIIDVGGGASTLVDDLLDRGFRNLTVLDISSNAFDIARDRLESRSTLVEWITCDVLKADLERSRYRLWHDRAVLHFLLKPEERHAYVRQVRKAVVSGGSVIISAFSPDGPTKCSGLETMRYSAESLLAEFGGGFHLRDSRSERHRTPGGVDQEFVSSFLTFEG